MNKLSFWIDRKPYHHHFDLRVVSSGPDEQRHMLTKVDYEPIPQNGYVGHIDPPFKLSQTDAQELMDELYRAGIRPTRMEGSAGALAATNRHLADLQKLVFREPTGELSERST